MLHQRNMFVWFAGTLNCACSPRSIGKSKSSPVPPSGEPPVSCSPSLSRSVYEWTLLPRVIVNSAPGTPSVSCQPNGDAVPSAGFVKSTRSLSSGLSCGYAR